MGRTPPDRRRGKASPHRRDPPVKWGGILTHHPSSRSSPGGPVSGGGGRRLSGPVGRRQPRRTPQQQQRRGRGGGDRGVARREVEEEKAELRPLPASEGSIYAGLFRELGGLIRWYADVRGGEGNDAIKTVKSMYTQSGCSVEGTKELILRELAGESPGIKAEESDAGWIDLSMVVEEGVGREGYQQSYDGGGLCLTTVDRAGDGPAHSHETWTNVIIPVWAVGKSYYFTVHNKSPLDLSCEISIDGHAQKAAKNVPVPAGAKRTIKPEARYYGSHKWVFSRAERVKLHQSAGISPVQRTHVTDNQEQKVLSNQRYNGLRPKDYSGRIDATDFPDPSSPPYYWKFTGSNEESKVEFYEKQMNLGQVRMDFYYTTGTVKTVLDHPHGGVNDLFRLCAVDPTKFKEILLNPRAHTNVGYRTKAQRTALEKVSADHATGKADDVMEVDMASSAAGGETGTDTETSAPTYWAKNDEYDFQRQGHANRKEAMGRLRPTDEFRAWEEAQKMEYACVHAKFFVSMAKKRSGRQNFRQAQRDPSADSLPKMTPVVDVKASERAVLATEFRSEGVKGSMAASSRVRMERVFGINDRPGWGTGPVFERKLYYRILDTEDRSDSENENMDQGEDDADIRRHEESLRENTPLDSYKEEKLGQLDKWHGELTLVKETTVIEMQNALASCKDGIRCAQDVQLVDNQVKRYWDQHQKHQWQA